jgi:TRAP-type mannitol/chloroaromatic compound transport system permease small subunit
MMKMLKRFLDVIDTTNGYTGRALSYVVLALTAVVFVSTVARYVFNFPIVWAFDMSLFIFLVYGLLGGGYAMLRHSHIVVDVFYRDFSPRTKAIVDLATSLITFFLCVVLIWFGTEVFLGMMSKGERLWGAWDVPLWPWRIFIPIGVTLLFFQVLAKFIRDFAIAVTREKKL